MPHSTIRILGAAALIAGPIGLGGLVPAPARADTVLTTADGIIRNSLCVGFDCPNNAAFSDSTILLMENNTRIKFSDTSAAASYPRNDWEIEANSNSNGGANYLGFNDCGTADNDGGCANDLVFAVEAGARASALYVESDGDVGIGTSNPVTDLHVVTGDTPTLRLEQDGSSGFTPQTWDLAGNETNFFVRDVTGGSQLPFRIRPGADSNALYINNNNDIGLGTSSPDAGLHVNRDMDNNVPHILVEATAPNKRAEIWFADDNTAADNDALRLQLLDDDFNISFNGTGGAELTVSKNGDVTVHQGDMIVSAGNFIAGGTTLNVPDYVFAPDYELMPLAELRSFVAKNSHLPRIPSAGEVKANGLNVTEMQLALLEKVEELTLYTLDQHDTIAGLTGQLAEQRAQIAALRQAIADQ